MGPHPHGHVCISVAPFDLEPCLHLSVCLRAPLCITQEEVQHIGGSTVFSPPSLCGTCVLIFIARICMYNVQLFAQMFTTIATIYSLVSICDFQREFLPFPIDPVLCFPGAFLTWRET